jgi:beta-lactamase regulating signal transducer with metallopeptidase domain
MEQFSFSFITMMMHSLWQTALLLLVYGTMLAGNPQPSPLFKRNFLYGLAGLQVLLSIFTYSIVSAQPSTPFFENYSLSLSPLLPGAWLVNNAVVILILYTLIVAGRLMHSFFLWTRFKKGHLKSVEKPSLEIRLFSQAKAYQFGISRKVAIWCSHAISTPMTFGFWKPVILLPFALMNQLSIRETEALIIHELTHIRQQDYLLNRLLVVMETLFFFNPFIHIIARKIRTEREKSCDAQVIMFSYGELQYAESLLKIARHQKQAVSLQLAAVKNKSQLLNRIRFFSDRRNLDFKPHRPVLTGGILMTALLIPLCLLLAIRQKEKSAENTGSIILASNTALVSNAEKEQKINTVETYNQRLQTNDYYSPYKKKKIVAAKPVEIKPIPEEEVINAVEYPDYAIPVLNAEQPVIKGQQITINDESSDGKKTTVVFDAFLVDGKWTLKPVWLITETKPAAGDSLTKVAKDSVIKIYPIVQ